MTSSISMQTWINILFLVLILYLLFGSGLNIRGRAVNDMHTTFGHEWSQNGPYEIMMVMDNGNVRIGDNNQLGNAKLSVNGPVGIGTVNVTSRDGRTTGLHIANDGVAIVGDVYATNPQDGQPRWLSEKSKDKCELLLQINKDEKEVIDLPAFCIDNVCMFWAINQGGDMLFESTSFYQRSSNGGWFTDRLFGFGTNGNNAWQSILTGGSDDCYGGASFFVYDDSDLEQSPDQITIQLRDCADSDSVMLYLCP